MSKLTINGRKCLLYECGDQPQVLLIQPVGVHEEATLDAEIDAIKGAVHVPFVFAGFAIGDWEEELTPWHDPNISPRQSVGDHAFETLGFITKQLIFLMHMRCMHAMSISASPPRTCFCLVYQ